MAVINPQQITNVGIALTYASASSGGDLINNSDDKTMVIIKNGGASSITVTASATVKCNFGELHDLELTIGAGAEKIIKLENYWNNTSGQVPLTYSATTSVTLAAFKY